MLATHHEPHTSRTLGLNQIMMSYSGHAHIHSVGEKKYVAGNIAKPGGLLQGGRISTYATANTRFNSD